MPNRPISRNMRDRPIPLNMVLGDRAGPDRVSEAEQQMSEVPPPVPSWLTSDAAPHWEMIAAQMVTERTWRPCCVPTLATYCELFSLFLTDPKGFGSTKLVTLRLLGADLGLTPSAFNRVSRAPGLSR